MASLVRGEKAKCSERARAGGCGATESGQGKPQGEALLEGNREEERRDQEHKKNSRGKKSPSQLSGDHKRAGPGTVHGCAVLTQRLWRQHLKHRNNCGLSDCIPPSSSVDILTHQLTVLGGGRALGGTRTPAEPSGGERCPLEGDLRTSSLALSAVCASRSQASVWPMLLEP